jgi:hypothetical protein
MARGFVLLWFLLTLVAVSSSLPKLSPSVRMLPQPKIDLWIVGAGTLGELIAKEWKLKYPSDTVIAETLSPQRHQSLRAIGAQPILRSERSLFT